MRRERMQDNLAVFQFELSTNDVAVVDALDQGESGRIGPNPDTYDWIP
jgi:2,5-diketo-D-gluconate reductase A